MAQVTMPKMSDTMEEGKIVRWIKHEGDPVREGEPIAEIETDKANVEMEAFESGVLGRILVGEDQTVAVGEPIASIEAAAAPAEAPSAQATRREEEAPKAESPAQVPPTRTEKEPTPEAAPAPPAAKLAPAAETGRILASPIARRIAEEQGIDLSKVPGTGPGGRITEADVQSFISGKPAPPPEAPPQPAPEAAPAPPKAVPAMGIPGEERELSKMRKTIAERMTKSKQTIPHFYVTTEIEMDWASRVRDELNADEGRTRISFTDMIIKSCALALAEHHLVNSSLLDGRVRLHKEVNVGMAVALEDGLIVTVVQDADTKDLKQIAGETKELAQHARDNKLSMHEYTGSTFTVSNLGMFDVESFSAVINPPEAASLAVGTIREVPVVIDGQVAVSKRMKATLSADHRVMQGAEAAKFLHDVKRRLESPISLL